jgi:hypothetical protein
MLSLDLSSSTGVVEPHALSSATPKAAELKQQILFIIFRFPVDAAPRTAAPLLVSGTLTRLHPQHAYHLPSNRAGILAEPLSHGNSSSGGDQRERHVNTCSFTVTQ